MHKAQLFDLVMVGNIATKHPPFLIVSNQHREGKHNRELFPLLTRCCFFFLSYFHASHLVWQIIWSHVQRDGLLFYHLLFYFHLLE